VGKAIKPSAGVKRLVSELTFDELRDLAPDLADILEDMAAEGGAAALAQVIAEITEDQLGQVSSRAVDYAAERSAELITDIEESSRDMVRSTVARGVEEGWTNERIADELEGNYAFGSKRAETIARTETAYADIQGNLEGYRASGVVSGKEWIVAQDEMCEDCEGLNGIVVGLDEQFPDDGGDGPPLHPNCRCDILPVLTEEE
jgi:SPP1 gp7 family putative phage head morphogenesis protein